MGIIQCAENCKYQKDGYCNLEKPTTVGSIDSSCPYRIPKSFYNSNCLAKTPDTDKL